MFVYYTKRKPKKGLRTGLAKQTIEEFQLKCYLLVVGYSHAYQANCITAMIHAALQSCFKHSLFILVADYSMRDGGYGSFICGIKD